MRYIYTPPLTMGTKKSGGSHGRRLHSGETTAGTGRQIGVRVQRAHGVAGGTTNGEKEVQKTAGGLHRFIFCHFYFASRCIIMDYGLSPKMTKMTKNIRFFVKRYEVYLYPPPLTMGTKKSERIFGHFCHPATAGGRRVYSDIKIDYRR
eukprot:COSAG01_NODE_32157_length_585_cov_1.592593_1_plen_149_part_00